MSKKMLDYFLLDKPDSYGLVTSQYYFEPLDWMIRSCEELYKHLLYSYSKNSIVELPDDTTKLLVGVPSVELDNISTRVVFDEAERPTVRLLLDSLLSIMKLGYISYLTAEAPTLKICKHCGSGFISHNVVQEFCSPVCRNRYNVYKSREKKK